MDTFDIKAHTLQVFVPAKHPEPILETVFQSFDKNELHGQQKCVELGYPFARSILKASPLISANILFQGLDETFGGKSVMEIAVDIKNFSEVRYEPGDTVGILPHNNDADVSFLIKAMEVENEADALCNLKVRSNCVKKTAKVPLHIPTNTTIREILRDCLHLRAAPKKQFLRALGDCCFSEDEKNFFNCLSSKEGSHLYNSLILEKCFNIFDLLRLCPSCKPSLELLTEHLPRLLPRPYSIANSHLKTKNELRLVFSILKDSPGVTTRMLKKISEPLLKEVPEEPNKILIYFREVNKFRYTSDDVVLNQILISIGTGVAPFIGFLEHKEHLVYSGEVTTSFGQTWLFAGAKSPDHLPYRKYFKELQQEGAILDKYFESFSKSLTNTNDYHYVQDLLKANSTEFINFLLLPQTVLYVCADGTKISKSIESSIVDCLKDVLKIEMTEAIEMIKMFRMSDKYREDLWK